MRAAALRSAIPWGHIMAQAKRSSADNVVEVDPQLQRPPNSEESVPEALVADVVHTQLHQRKSPARWHRIQQRAYEIAQARGLTPGAELNDWLQAEREIDGESTRQAAPEDQFTG